VDDEISFSLVSNISALAMMPAIAVARLALPTEFNETCFHGLADVP